MATYRESLVEFALFNCRRGLRSWKTVRRDDVRISELITVKPSDADPERRVMRVSSVINPAFRELRSELEKFLIPVGITTSI